MTTSPSRLGMRIRSATPADGDALIELISLIDLHQPPEAVPAVLGRIRQALTDTDDGPLSHRLNHLLISETADAVPVGVITCGPAQWMADPKAIPRFMYGQLVRRIATVHSLAVRPEYRGRSIARDLLHQAEQAFQDAGYAALTLRHERDLTRFYRRLGYTSSNRLSLMLPMLGLFTVNDRGWKHSFKVLSPDAAVTTVQGLPTITGVLPG